MGLWGLGRNKKEDAKPTTGSPSPAPGDEHVNAKGPEVESSSSSSSIATLARPQAPSPPPATETSVFEFGSAGSSEERITLAGYCPVSDGLEPCRWEILPSGGSYLDHVWNLKQYSEHFQTDISGKFVCQLPDGKEASRPENWPDEAKRLTKSTEEDSFSQTTTAEMKQIFT